MEWQENALELMAKAFPSGRIRILVFGEAQLEVSPCSPCSLGIIFLVDPDDGDLLWTRDSVHTDLDVAVVALDLLDNSLAITRDVRPCIVPEENTSTLGSVTVI